MRLYLWYSIVLVCCMLNSVHGEPEPRPKSVIQLGNGRRSSFFNEPASIKTRSVNADQDVQIVDDIDDDDDDDDTFVAGTDNKATINKDSSSGRLFLRSFLLFKNIFKGGNKQPVIPIIITGPGAGTATNPTSTTTSTGTIPTASGTITTSPIAAPGTGTGGAGTGGAGTGGGVTGGAGTGGGGAGGGGLNRITIRTSNPQEEAEDDEQMANDEAAAEPSYGGVANEQTLQAALAAGAQEYIVTDADIQGTGNAGNAAKANRQPSRINLRRKGTRRGQGQVISVRIPSRYRRYFKNGQKVMLNTQGYNKRRVVRKRNQNKRRPQSNRNKNKRNKNKNKRQRIVTV